MNWSVALAGRKVAIICGPTAAGKSAIAMGMARALGARIISADSRQVYRHFTIGTAKPSDADRRDVPHDGIDLIEPAERYSAAAWSDAAQDWLAAAGDQPTLIVGGTGFYLRALVEPLFAAPPVDATARAQVLDAFDALPTEELRARCAVIDPARAHLGRTQLLRALETFELTGRPLSEWMLERARESTVEAAYLLVDPGSSLRERIATRVHAMLDAGWEQEVARLIDAVPADAPAWNACGYAEIRDALLGQRERADAVERTIISTRQYAKRQRTWFRHQLPAAQVTPLDPLTPDALAAALRWFYAVHQQESM